MKLLWPWPLLLDAYAMIKYPEVILTAIAGNPEVKECNNNNFGGIIDWTEQPFTDRSSISTVAC